MKPAIIIMIITWLGMSRVHAEGTRQEEKTVPVKQVMGEIYEALRAVLPYSLSRSKFEDPKFQAILRKNFKTLAEKSSILPEHTQFHDATFRYLGSALAHDAVEMNRHFEQGNFRQALYRLHSLTENCVACHSRLPAASSSRAEGLFREFDASSLMLDEKARLYIVTRQFDKGMEAYKDILLSDEYQTDHICATDWISEYLVIAIRVRRDFQDARTTLAKFQRRQGLPTFAQQDLAVWQRSIDKLAKMKHLKPNLPSIRLLLAEAKKQIEFPLDRQGQIHYLLASSLLHEYVQTNPKGIDAAEAYFYLGLTESMTGPSQWLSQNEYYLETAIRSAPASTFASKAYNQLEEAIVLGHTGSSGTHIPDEQRARLEELRQQIQAAKAGKGVPAPSRT